METARLTAVVKIKNGYLWEAVQKLGSVRKLAEYLGLDYGRTVNLVNLRDYPYQAFNVSSRVAEKWQKIEEKLLLLIGVGFDEIFPKELNSEAFNRKPKQYALTRDVPVLSLTGFDPAQLTTSLEDVDEKIEKEELANRFNDVLLVLKPREETIVRMRYGLAPYDREYTFEECAEYFDITIERARQISVRALEKLRHPNRSRALKAFAADML